jgi:hypothetical protein
MARKPKKQLNDQDEGEAQTVPLARFMSQKAVFQHAVIWIVGDAPLIVHSWSEKAKHEMLQKQVKATKPGKAARNPEQEFTDSLYVMQLKDGSDVYGFPCTAVKKCMLSAAHKDKGIPRDTVMRSVWFNAPFVRVRTAVDDAICDLPLVRLWGSDPEMREDMVRIGVGLTKTANLAYRAQFKIWAMRIGFRYNASVISEDVIAALITESGMSCGIGDWRNEKNGMFGSFHLAGAYGTDEVDAWEKFARGKGPLPRPNYPDDFQQAAE